MPLSRPVSIEPVPFPGHNRRQISAAALWWLSDTAGAVLFAACIALLLGDWTAGSRTPDTIFFSIIGIIISGLIRAVAQGAAAFAGQREANGIKQALRTRLIGALLPTGLIRERLIGEDMHVAIDDVEAYEGLVARFAPLRLAAVLSPLLIALVVAFASWVCALIMLMTLIPFGAGMAFAGLAGKAEAERQLLALSRLSGLFVDRVATLPIILAFAAEERVTRQIGQAAREVASRTMQVLRIAFVSSAVLEFFAALSVALVAVYCGFSLLGLLPFPAPETLTLSRAFFALALAPEFYLGMRRMAAAYHDKQQGEAAEKSMKDALNLARECHISAVAPAPVIPTVRCLAARQLDVTYADGTRIGPFSAEWRGPGLHAVTGETGAGKSSLLHAVIGLVPSLSGGVELNGESVSPASLAMQVGWAGQRPLLLPGTLKDNLLLGGPIDEERLMRLVEVCGLTELAARRGLDLVIDPRGSGLSGGERRRIGLIRAIASDRPILLLDEPTADLDGATARRVITCLEGIAGERLVLAATHDPMFVASSASTLRLT